MDTRVYAVVTFVVLLLIICGVSFWCRCFAGSQVLLPSVRRLLRLTDAAFLLMYASILPNRFHASVYTLLFLLLVLLLGTLTIYKCYVQGYAIQLKTVALKLVAAVAFYALLLLWT